MEALSDLSDRELQKKVKADRREVAKLAAAPADAEVVRRVGLLVDDVNAAEAEIGRRQFRSNQDLAWARRERREREERRRQPSPLSAVARLLHTSGAPPEITGLALDPDNLQGDEADELLALTQARAKGALDDEGWARWEVLLGRAVGDSGLFPRKRRERQQAAEQAALVQAEREAALPERTVTGRGLAVLPQSLFEELVDRRPDTLSIADVGVLAAVVLSIEGRIPLLPNSRMENGVLVVDGVDQLALPGYLNADGRDDVGSPGRIRVRPAVDMLHRGGWLQLDTSRGDLRITIGERLKEVIQHASDSQPQP